MNIPRLLTNSSICAAGFPGFSRDQIETVIDELYLHPQLKDTEYVEAITLLSGRWYGLLKEKVAGTAELKQIWQENAAIINEAIAINYLPL